MKGIEMNDEFTRAEALNFLIGKDQNELTEEEKEILKFLIFQKEIMDESDKKSNDLTIYLGMRPHRYIDKQGNPISMWQWASKNESKYKIIQQDQIGPYFISTIWIGFNLGCFDNVLIFETMIFCDSNEEDDLAHWQERYATEQEAIDGHEEACKLCRDII